MHSLTPHVLFWLVAVAVALFCLWRAWHHGSQKGLDERTGIAKDRREYFKVRMWGTFGAGLLLLVLLNVFLFFNPEPASR